MLKTLGALDPDNTNLIHFNVENYNSRLPHQLTFQIMSRLVGRKVHRIVLDEGYSTSILFMSCWRALISIELTKSPTTLKSFNGRGFQPHGLLLALSVELGGKTVSIQVEVVDAPLDYNILLGIKWFYPMKAVTSIIFWTLQFPHLGNIVTIDQLDFCSPDFTTPTANNIPMIGQSPTPYQLVGVGMLKDSTLMGVFPSTPPST